MWGHMHVCYGIRTHGTNMVAVPTVRILVSRCCPISDGKTVPRNKCQLLIKVMEQAQCGSADSSIESHPFGKFPSGFSEIGGFLGSILDAKKPQLLHSLRSSLFGSSLAFVTMILVTSVTVVNAGRNQREEGQFGLWTTSFVGGDNTATTNWCLH